MKPEQGLVVSLFLVGLMSQPAYAQNIDPWVKRELKSTMREAVGEELSEQRNNERVDAQYRANSEKRSQEAGALSSAQREELRKLDQVRQQDIQRQVNSAINDEGDASGLKALTLLPKIRANNSQRAWRDLQAVKEANASPPVGYTGYDAAAVEDDRNAKLARRSKAEQERKSIRNQCEIKPVMSNADIERCKKDRF
jgi:hypothetical protein